MKYINEVGKWYGSLLVVGEVPLTTHNRKRRVLAVCRCGQILTVYVADLRYRNRKSCRSCFTSRVRERASYHEKKQKLLNAEAEIRWRSSLIGFRFGLVTITEGLGSNKRGARMVRIKCDCGTTKSVRLYSLQGGGIRSCGCLRSKKLRESKC